MSNELKIVCDIRVYSLEDRTTIAGILTKNGYCVSQVKKAKEGSSKSFDYCLRVREDPDGVQATR